MRETRNVREDQSMPTDAILEQPDQEGEDDNV
jgi:hypothetical protein